MSVTRSAVLRLGCARRGIVRGCSLYECLCTEVASRKSQVSPVAPIGVDASVCCRLLEIHVTCEARFVDRRRQDEQFTGDSCSSLHGYSVGEDACYSVLQSPAQDMHGSHRGVITLNRLLGLGLQSKSRQVRVANC